MNGNTTEMSVIHDGNISDAIRLVRFFLFSTPRNRRLSYYAWNGDHDDAVQDCLLKVMRSKPTQYNLSTVIANSVKWARAARIHMRKRGIRTTDISEARAISYRDTINYFTELHTAIGELGQRSREILSARYGLDGNGVKTLRQIASKYRITPQRVRQIELRAVLELQTGRSRWILRSLID